MGSPKRMLTEIVIQGKTLKEILEEHQKSLDTGQKAGKRANLTGADLSKAHLSMANLSGADLSKTNLSQANLIGADLSGVNLYKADLSDANLSGANLSGADLSEAQLYKANLSGANLRMTNLNRAGLSKADLSGADLSESNLFHGWLDGANLFGTNLSGVNLSKAYMHRANFSKADLSGANLSGAALSEANLSRADLSGADLSDANMSESNLTGADLYGATLSGADLSEADLSEAKLDKTNCVETNFTNAILVNVSIYGISVWDAQIAGLKQKNLIITRDNEPIITVDSIEVAQFIYLILNNKKIRDVIGTIANKGVLILGRFTPDRKKVLDAIRDKLREHDLVPIMFDFEKASDRDFTETIKILAGMSRFVIADITDPKSSPLELQATIPDYGIPFLPIIQEGQEPFSMFNDLFWKYKGVMDPIKYKSSEDLLTVFKKAIIDRAETKHQELLLIRNQSFTSLSTDDFREVENPKDT